MTNSSQYKPIMNMKQEYLAAIIAYRSGKPILTRTEFFMYWNQIHAVDPHWPELYPKQVPEKGTDVYSHVLPLYSFHKAYVEADLKPFLERFKDEVLTIHPKLIGNGLIKYRLADDHYRVLSNGDGITGKCIYTGNENETHSIEDPAPIQPLLARAHDSYEVSIDELLHYTIRPPYNIDKVKRTLAEIWYDRGGIEMEGVVLKVRSEKRQMLSGHSPTHINWALSWEPKFTLKSDNIRGIHWYHNIKSQFIPTIETETEDLELPDAETLIDMKIAICDSLDLCSDGTTSQPYIMRAHSSNQTPVDGLKVCPDCGEKLVWMDEHLECHGDDCILPLAKRLNYFYSHDCMNLKRVGLKLIWELLQDKDVRKILSEKPWLLLSKNFIDDQAWACEYTDLIQESIDKVYGKRTADHFLKGLLGCGPEVFKRAQADLFDFKFAPSVIDYVRTYAITGKIENLDDFNLDLAKKNWKQLSYVHANIDYLIMGKLKKPSSKLSLAQHYNIQILTEAYVKNVILKGNSNEKSTENEKTNC